MVAHPDYPHIEFKPAIAMYDWDQTYDVLQFYYLPQGIEIIQSLNIPAYRSLAIDRYTPFTATVPWCDRYSDYLFDFLKTFNFCPHNALNSAAITGLNYPVFSYQGTKYDKTAKYEITLGKGEYCLSFLVNQWHQDTITDPILTLNQTYKKINIKANGTKLDVNKIINGIVKDNYPLAHSYYLDAYDNPVYQYNPDGTPVYVYNEDSLFVANSLVISKRNTNGNYEVYPASFSQKYLLYSDIEWYYNDVKNAMVTYFEALHDSFRNEARHNKYTYPLQSCLKRVSYPILYDYADLHSGPPTITNGEKVLTFEQFPDYMRDHCWLQRANNNQWGGNVYSDLGVTPPNQIDSLDSVINTTIVNDRKIYGDKTVNLVTLQQQQDLYFEKVYPNAQWKDSFPAWLGDGRVLTWDDILQKTNMYPSQTPDLATTIPSGYSFPEFNIGSLNVSNNWEQAYTLGRTWEGAFIYRPNSLLFYEKKISSFLTRYFRQGGFSISSLSNPMYYVGNDPNGDVWMPGDSYFTVGSDGWSTQFGFLYSCFATMQQEYGYAEKLNAFVCDLIFCENSQWRRMYKRKSPGIYAQIVPYVQTQETIVERSEAEIFLEKHLLNQSEWEEIINYGAMTTQEMIEYLQERKQEAENNG